MRELSNIILMSIKSEHAKNIYNGMKKIELRKSFSEEINFVFLIETAPISAITGGFLVEHSKKDSINRLLELANNGGVSEERLIAYFKGRSSGWAIKIGIAIRFKTPIPFSKLRDLNHYFKTPQSYCYLMKFESLTQHLLSIFIRESQVKMFLKKFTKKSLENFVSLVNTEVEPFYDDIDSDFINQTTNNEVSKSAAFSTKNKQVYEFLWGSKLIGFTVLTEKKYGAWKSGPSLLLPKYRDLGLGQVLRNKIEKYIKKRGGLSVYCTCPSDKGHVISYLLNSGMNLQSCLKKHLNPNSDEYVFSKKFSDNKVRPSYKGNNNLIKASLYFSRVTTENPEFKKFLSTFVSNLKKWYFQPDKKLLTAISKSIKSLETGRLMYSEKGRYFHVCHSKTDRPYAFSLATIKRSNMIKINFVSLYSNENLYKNFFNYLMQEFNGYRRIYLTTPISNALLIEVLNKLGFSFEGILEDPFFTGNNHVSLGYLNSKIKELV